MAGGADKVKVSPTAKFSVIDPKSSKANHVSPGQSSSSSGSHKTRLTESTGKLIDQGKGRIGGDFTQQPNPEFLRARLEKCQAIEEKQKERLATKPREPIRVTLPDGTVKEGTSYETTPMEIAKAISKNLAKEVLVAEVKYARRIEDDEANVSSADGLEADAVLSGEDENGAGGGGAAAKAELWDLLRPLIGDCEMRLLKFDDREAKAVFWHSAAHCLGLAMEKKWGCHLTHGPPVEQGFFYDCFMGENAVLEKDLAELDREVQRCCKQKHTFDRILLTKEEAMDMFGYNAFKREYISTRIPDGGCTTVYRNGEFVDLCRGPHVPHTTMIQAFKSIRTSATSWLGKTENDPLQRVYGVAFPDKARMKKWQEFQEQAKLRDHRRLGLQQDLFFFHPLSPGSAFFLPHGTRMYNRLMNFIRQEYWKRGYEEVTSPNIYNMELWNISGHALHYKDNMFRFDIEGQEFGLKPMNCPGHCLMFSHSTRSHKDLPLRLADFGVLHRNEVSGALTGLTRVRRFCQDDAHIFCREDQIKDEVLASLDFMKTVYDVFGMRYKLELSTRPEKALGDASLWEVAEESLAAALDEFAGKGNWRVNAGDGAFYGPKIDIKVFDALERMHQCATVQLDFQLPIRFNLKYMSSKEDQQDGAPAGGEAQGGGNAGAEAQQGAGAGGKKGDTELKRPVMVHRAMLGSVERMVAVLTEHYGGRWPFWLSPRQALLVPVAAAHNAYALSVRRRLHDAGFYCDAETSNKTLNKKVREGETSRYNFILVLGDVEQGKDEVNLRGIGNKTVDDTIAYFQQLTDERK